MRWLPFVLGLAVSLACLTFIVRKIDLEAARQALLQFEWRYLMFGVACLAFGYAMRILRWAKMLQAAGSHVSFRQCIAPFLGSIAMNNVLPLRLGDVVRALVFPASIGVPRTLSTASLVMERLVDLMTLVMCLALSLSLDTRLAAPQWLKDTAVTLAIFGCAALLLGFVFSGAIASRLRQHRLRGLRALAQLMEAFDAMTRPNTLVALISLSLLVWLGEAGLFYFLLLGFGLPAVPAAALLIMSIATLATLVPSSPGYVGPFHLAAFTGISLLGGTGEQAASFAVLSHLALWLPTTLAGALAVATTPRMFRSLRNAPAPQESTNTES
ncbi:flippase-like domain-containing protein [Variovorax sp. PAMC28562]|nr:flippase-like domain-containing protein [Variovorax sp. PAMC28562]